jgi:hypothetical protein
MESVDYRQKLAEIMLKRKEREDQLASPEAIEMEEANARSMRDASGTRALAAALSNASGKIGTMGG